MRHVTVPPEARRRLSRLGQGSRDRLRLLSTPDCRMLARMCAMADWDNGQPARVVARYLDVLPGWPVANVRRAAIALLALEFPANAPAFELPPSIRALYAPAFLQLARHLDQADDYGDEEFAKDIRFVLGLSTPGGVQDIDVAWRADGAGLFGRFKRTSANIGRLALSADAAGLSAFLDARPHRPWLQIHTDGRRLGEFHPEGWDQCYRRIADLLALHPEYAGMVGQSWFYDPAICSVSPRLTYLQARPLENGAVRIRLGADADDVERATRTSERRRALYAAGDYQPRCWAIYWPRDALLGWARGTGAALSARAAA